MSHCGESIRLLSMWPGSIPRPGVVNLCQFSLLSVLILPLRIFL